MTIIVVANVYDEFSVYPISPTLKSVTFPRWL